MESIIGTDPAERACPDWLQPLTIGVVMLETRFPRAMGDIGNPETLFGRGRYRRVASATVGSVISEAPIASEVTQRVVEAALELATLEVDAVLTSCGFLQEIQHTLQQRVGVPVVSSALGLLPDLLKASGELRIGVLTFDATRLVDRHLGSTEFRDRCVLIGMESSSHFYSMIADDRTRADPEKLRSDALDAAVVMAAQEPAAVILECTNLAPWKNEIESIVGVPVFDLMDALRWRLSDVSVGLPPRYQGPSASARS